MSIYEQAVRGWIDEPGQKGRFKDTGQEELDRIIREYARRLEEIFHEEMNKASSLMNPPAAEEPPSGAV